MSHIYHYLKFNLVIHLDKMSVKACHKQAAWLATGIIKIYEGAWVIVLIPATLKCIENQN